jgi:AraC-like DNA-binding protein
MKIFFAGILLFLSHATLAYKVITPVPFSVANKNYIKVQVLAEKGDLPSDSVFCDVLYNSGSRLSVRLDASLSTVLKLNQFNDGLFYVVARIYHQGKCDTLGSSYDVNGIPVLLDRHLALNETKFSSSYLSGPATSKSFDEAVSYSFSGNNNTVRFSSTWNEDSLYFRFRVNDAQLDYATPSSWDFFKARKYLKVLWTSDCLELGFDLLHDHTEWKHADDFELLADIKGDRAGNQWDVQDSLYNHWGREARISVTAQGSINNNQDMDTGYTLVMAIPWSAMKFIPHGGQSIGFDVQLYDKDGDLDEPFRSSLSGTNPESNDNTSEWVNLVLEQKPAKKMAYLYWLLVIPILLLVVFFIRSKKTRPPAPPATDIAQPPVYSESITKTIQLITTLYQDPELSRGQLAEQVFLSEKYLSSLFKKEVGENLVAYINKYRITRAVQLLKETRLSISEIAFSVGYSSIQHFNKNFKTVTQQSPSDFRKSVS